MKSSRSSRKAANPSTPTRENERSRVYPFTAIVGQEEMKLALLLNAIDPIIGGVLIMGHRGTGKSTAVRGLAELLPEIAVVQDCTYRCDPKDPENLCADCTSKLDTTAKLQTGNGPVRVVTLPLGATEDRVCGTIDIQRVLQSGVKAFDPGLLAQANRGFLYIDEVNLLDDHLIDLLLDAAATGRNRVEREGISVEHPARFVLIGSGNPEEGELRPQLQDRFGLHVEVRTDNSPDSRMAVVEARVAFDKDPPAFLRAADPQQVELRSRIIGARKKLPKVRISQKLLRQIASLCSDLQIDGHRGELTITRAARAVAALEDRSQVTAEDIGRIAVMSLRHRLRRDALEETAGTDQINDAVNRALSSSQEQKRRSESEEGEPSRASRGAGNARSTEADSHAARASTSVARPEGREWEKDQAVQFAEPDDSEAILEKLKPSEFRTAKGRGKTGVGKTGVRAVCDDRGRYRCAVNHRTNHLALAATVRAFATEVGRSSTIGTASLRYKLFTRKSGSLFIFAIDTSGSMALNRIREAKGALLHLLKRSYIERDQVAVVAFGGDNAKMLLPPSRSMLRARRVLDTLTIGGGTPLAAGLACSLEIAKRAARQKLHDVKLLIFTDGRPNVPFRSIAMEPQAEKKAILEREVEALGAELHRAGVTTTVIDTTNQFAGTGNSQRVAELLGAQLTRITTPSRS